MIDPDELCDECGAECGNQTEMADGRFLCRECLWDAGVRAQQMKEMADDDKAHAARERWMEEQL